MEHSIAVFGLGFVGLPLALVYASKGHPVIGVDIDELHVAKLKMGQTPLCEPWEGKTIQEGLIHALQKGMFEPTFHAEEAIRRSTEVIVTVGIPVRSDGTLDYTSLDSVATFLGKHLRPGMTILLRSTVPPHTTRNRFKPLLEEYSHLSAGKDFYLGYASERMAEGKAYEELTSMPTPVAGINEASLEKCTQLLSKICSQVISAQNLEAVEMSKVVENLSRDINVAMVNEFANYAYSIGVDIAEVLSIANTHQRVKLLSPGPGVGGYCIPNAFYYLAGTERPCADLPVSSTSRQLNDQRPSAILAVAEEELKKLKKDLPSAQFALYGLGMKDFSNDLRLSPSLEFIRLLRERKYLCRFFDPLTEYPEPGMCHNLEELLEGADCLIILNRHHDDKIHQLDKIKKLMNNRPLIVDTRSWIDAEKAKKKGFTLCRC